MDSFDQHILTLLQRDASISLKDLPPGVQSTVINSIHHQAVKRLGRDVTVEATASDGVVEAIRWEGRSFVCGVQWHPEFHLTPGEEVEGLLDSGPMMMDFLRAARARADRHQSGAAVVHPGVPLSARS